MKLRGITDKGMARMAHLVKGQDMGKTWDELSPDEQAAIEEEEFQLEQGGAQGEPGALGVEDALDALVRSILTGSFDDSINPYFVPEIKAALQALAAERGIENWRDAVDIDHG